MEKKSAIPLLAMGFFLIISWGFDLAKAALKNSRISTFTLTNLWVDLLIELVFAGMVILFVWLILFKVQKSSLVDWIFIILGLLAFLQSTPFKIYLNPFSSIDIPPRYIRDDYSIFIQGYYSIVIGFSSFLSRIPIFGFFTRASALITALGVTNFFRKSR
jgi:hypothetical protein